MAMSINFGPFTEGIGNWAIWAVAFEDGLPLPRSHHPHSAAIPTRSISSHGRALTATHRSNDVDPLPPRNDYAALAEAVYLNQASLGLIPADTVEVMMRHLTETAQHGNLHLTDEQEIRILDDLRRAGANLLGAPLECVAVIGGASAGLAPPASPMRGRWRRSGV